MSFLNDVAKKTARTTTQIAKKTVETTNKIAQKTTETTNKIVTETKLKLQIGENKTDISNLYKEIGEKLYEKHTRQEDTIIPLDLLEICKDIDEIEVKIEDLRQEILDLNKQEDENSEEESSSTP